MENYKLALQALWIHQPAIRRSFFRRGSEKRRTGKGKNLFVRIFILSSSTAAINSIMFLTVLEV